MKTSEIKKIKIAIPVEDKFQERIKIIGILKHIFFGFRCTEIFINICQIKFRRHLFLVARRRKMRREVQCITIYYVLL